MLSDAESKQQEIVRRQHNIDLLALRRPSRIGEIEQRIKKQCNPLPKVPLPRWNKLSLDQKIPLIPANPGEFIFSQGNLGESIFQCGCTEHFDNVDPYIRETPIKYNSLHDPALKKYFKSRPYVRDTLIRQGLMSCKGEVLCSISELNKAREYLHRLHSAHVNEERERQDKFSAALSNKAKEIQMFSKREENDQRHADVAAQLKAFREDIDNQERLAEMRPLKEASKSGREKMVAARAFYNLHRDSIRYQVLLRLMEKEKAEIEQNRNMIKHWHCEDSYRAYVRCELQRHKELKLEAELDDFVKSKREYQEHKERYERAILMKHKLEQQCAIMRRAKYYQKLEKARETANARKEALENKIKARELYLMKKYGYRWLSIAAAKRNAVATYHDSLWAIRGQLRELVEYLREESGTISFTTFIQGLVKLKPGHPKIEMSEETREVVTYVLDLLLQNTFKTHMLKKTSCLLDFWSDETRKKIAKMKCPKEDMIQLEDFIPPTVKKRKKRIIPFIKPPNPCIKRDQRESREDFIWVDKIIKEKRSDLQEKRRYLCKDLKLEQGEAELTLPSRTPSHAAFVHKREDENISRESTKPSDKEKMADSVKKEKFRPSKTIKKKEPVQEESKMDKPPVDVLMEKKVDLKQKEDKEPKKEPIKKSEQREKPEEKSLPPQETLEDKISDAMEELREKIEMLEEKTKEPGVISQEVLQLLEEVEEIVEDATESLQDETKVEDDRIDVPDDKIEDMKQEEAISQVREETGQGEQQEEPPIPPPSPDYSWVEKIIKDKREKLQTEKDDILDGILDEVEDDSISRVASCLAFGSLCKELRDERRALREKEGKEEPEEFLTLEEENDFVENIITERRETLIELLKEEAAIGRVSDEMVDENIENQENVQEEATEEFLLSRRTSSDYSWVDKIIRDKRNEFQEEKDDIIDGMEDGLEISEDGTLSRVASCLAGVSLCQELRNERQALRQQRGQGEQQQQEEEELNLGEQKVETLLPPRTSSDYSWVDKIIKDKRDQLQTERDNVLDGKLDEVEDESISRVASCLAVGSLCKELRDERRALREKGDSSVDAQEFGEIKEVPKEEFTETSLSESDPKSKKESEQEKQQEEEPLPKRTSSDYSFVDKIINDKREELQQEKDDVHEGKIDEVDDKNLSRVASCLANDSLCKELREERKAAREKKAEEDSKLISPKSDYGFVDNIIKEKRDTLQQETDEVAIARVSQEITEDAIKKQKESLQEEQIARISQGMTDEAIQKQKDALEKENEHGNIETMINRVSDEMAEKAIGKQVKVIESEISEQSSQWSSQSTSEASSMSYFDPEEDGISPLRSEVRLQLNMLRQELTDLRVELQLQGILSADSSLTPSSAPSRTGPPPPPPPPSS